MCIYVYMSVYIGVCPCGQVRKAGGLHHSCPSGHASLESDLQRSKKKNRKKNKIKNCCPSGHASLESDLQRSRRDRNKIEKIHTKKTAFSAGMRACSHTVSAGREIHICMHIYIYMHRCMYACLLVCMYV